MQIVRRGVDRTGPGFGQADVRLNRAKNTLEEVG